jgi:hypothetical protein
MTESRSKAGSAQRTAGFGSRTAYFGHQLFGQGDRAVLVEPETARQLRDAAEQALPHETGGLLLGRTCSDEEGRYVLVDGFVQARPGARRLGGFRFAKTGLGQLRAEAASQYPAADEVGWWHSHAEQGAYSPADRDTQRDFQRPESVGLLVFGTGLPWATAYLGPEARHLGRPVAVPATGRAAPAPVRTAVPAGGTVPPADRAVPPDGEAAGSFTRDAPGAGQRSQGPRRRLGPPAGAAPSGGRPVPPAAAPAGPRPGTPPRMPGPGPAPMSGPRRMPWPPRLPRLTVASVVLAVIAVIVIGGIVVAAVELPTHPYSPPGRSSSASASQAEAAAGKAPAAAAASPGQQHPTASAGPPAAAAGPTPTGTPILESPYCEKSADVNAPPGTFTCLVYVQPSDWSSQVQWINADGQILGRGVANVSITVSVPQTIYVIVGPASRPLTSVPVKLKS